MKRHAKIFVVLVMSVVLTAQSKPAHSDLSLGQRLYMVVCGDWPEIEELLAQEEMHREAIGLSRQGSAIIVYRNGAKDFLFIDRSPTGQTCLFQSGSHWQFSRERKGKSL